MNINLVKIQDHKKNVKFLKKKKQLYINPIIKSFIIFFGFIFCILKYNKIITNIQVYKLSEEKSNNFMIYTYDLNLPTLLEPKKLYNINGTIKSNKKIKYLEILIYDKNQFEVELNYSNYIFSNTLKLKHLNKYNIFEKLFPGEKTLIINIFDNHNYKISIKNNFTILGKAKEPIHITNLCKFEISYFRGNFNNILNFTDKDYFNFGNITIMIPSSKKIDGILIKFHSINNNITLKSYTITGKELYHYTNKGRTKFHEYYELNEKTSTIQININNTNNSKGITSIRIYEKGKVGISVEKWKNPPKKCDLMVASAHRDDELLFFGGTIPYYHGVRKKKVCTVFFSGNDILRIREALASQWSMGIKNYPIFMGFKGGYHNGVNGVFVDWGGENYVFNKTVSLIRKYKPDVIVTHDINGEYGHPTHKLLPYLIKKSILMSKDKNIYNESYIKYGIHQIKKLYLHNYYKNDIIINWNESSSLLDRKTPFEVALVGYDKYYSQHNIFRMNDNRVRKYPNDKYELIYTIVGNDIKKNDFFENII